MKRLIIYAYFLLSIPVFVHSQSKVNSFLKPSDTLNKKRQTTVILGEAVFTTASLVGLDRLWYADYPRSKFKTIDDSDEWLQMDKAGHIFSSYQLGRLGANAFKWSGSGKKEQLIYGASLGLVFLTSVEVMDGFSEEWGFSWTDVASNALGTGFFVGQELLWSEQRLLIKYSFSPTTLANQRPSKLGDGYFEEFLKDYNGQTYWLSANINSFFNTTFLPDWLNVAFGYGAYGMLTGLEDNSLFPNQNRLRQFYLSLDIDLSKIKTNSHFLRSILDVLNVIKVPFPALELNSQGDWKLHYIRF